MVFLGQTIRNNLFSPIFQDIENKNPKLLQTTFRTFQVYDLDRGSRYLDIQLALLYVDGKYFYE